MRRRELTDEQRDLVGRCRKRLGETLRRLRKACGLSQEAASHRAGLDNKTVGRIERGEVTPTLDTFVLLVAVYSRRPSEFQQHIAAIFGGIAFRETRQCLGRLAVTDGPFVVEVWRVNAGG